MKKLSVEQIAQEEKLRAPKPATGTSKERYVKVTFLIVTEGTKTEPNYLNALKKVLEATNRFNIEISIEGKGKATKALVNKIVRQIENCNQEYDRVWQRMFRTVALATFQGCIRPHRAQGTI